METNPQMIKILELANTDLKIIITNILKMNKWMKRQRIPRKFEFRKIDGYSRSEKYTI